MQWAVEGREPHRATPRFSRRSSGTVADWLAEWPIGCEDLRELALGGVVKALGIDVKDLVARTAPICTAP